MEGQVITQGELRSHVELSRKVEEMTAQLEALEASLQARVKDGATVQPGLLRLSFRADVPYKSVNWAAIARTFSPSAEVVAAHTKTGVRPSLKISL